MRPLFPVRIAAIALIAIFAGCGTLPSGNSCAHAMYDGKTGMEPYADAAHKFHLCVPGGLTRQGPTGTANGRVVFSGFAVPTGTNLESKTLVIAPGSYVDMQGAAAFGEFTAGGVTFKRARLDDGSAGHSTLHIVYTWKTDGQPVHFDFTHRSVNPGVFDPGKRPAQYDRAAQLTEEIMGTFARLP